MNAKIKSLVQEISALQEELREELQKAEEDFSLKNGKVIFSQKVLMSQKEKLVDLFTYLKEAPLINIISAPVIYMMIIPALLLDVMLFIYVVVVFRVYKFPKIRRSDYIVFDRQYLGYLNILEKINCVYCAYFNGLINYTAAVAGRTELYFCPIKHAKKIAYAHQFYYDFLPYGDAQTYREKLKACQKKAQESA